MRETTGEMRMSNRVKNGGARKWNSPKSAAQLSIPSRLCVDWEEWGVWGRKGAVPNKSWQFGAKRRRSESEWVGRGFNF